MLHGILQERGHVALNPATGSGEELLRSALNKAELEALEALKLQYFQNATRFLAKGEYDKALAEIKRVLQIDPAHRLAREYEIRVTELQASRAQLTKAEAAPRNDPPKAEPAPPHVVVEAAAPAPRRPSRKSWLYVALIASLLLGTAGVLTLEKVEEAEPVPVATVAPASEHVSAPAEQPEEVGLVEEPTPSIAPLTTLEPKSSLGAAEKSAPPPEPVRRDPPVRSAAGTTQDENLAPSGVRAKAAVVPAEKTVEPPPPVQKEIPAPQLETKLVASLEPAKVEPVRESAPFVAIQQDPKIVHLEKPRLPDLVLRNHMSGEVTAKVLIDKDGKPQEIQIVSSTNSVFEPSVIDAIERSTFSPGVMGEGPVAAWVVIPFRFK